MNKQKLASLKDAIDTLSDQLGDFQQLLDDLSHYQRRETELQREINRLESILDEYGIDASENRQWRISAIFDFIKGLGI